MKFSVSSWPSRPSRLFVLALGGALAGGVALAAWAAADELPMHRSPPVGAMPLPQGRMLDRALDEADASPTQRAQVHQIFEAADADLRQNRSAERSDRDQMARLFTQPVVDRAAVEAVRESIGARREAESRRLMQALVDASLVLNVDQRRAIAGRLAAAPRPLGAGRGASTANE
ncbi:MAG: periplasmic heavy metal sensor [Burkholderiaceae bacterium]